MRYISFFLFALISVSFPLALFAATVSSERVSFFPRTLSPGMEGDDVLLLQKILNSRRETRVTYNGPGSLGKESNFFGPKTASAVRKFQELYRNDILTPAGMILGNGIAGPRTRQKLETLLSATLTVPEEAKMPTTTEATSAIVLSTLSPLQGPTGTVVTLSGTGFGEKNEIHTGYGIYWDVASSDGKTLQFRIDSPIPTSMRAYIPELPIRVFVVNASGISNVLEFTITSS